MQVSHLRHRWGGRIASIESIEHRTIDGVADWFYRGTIEWDDYGTGIGKRRDSVATEIPPWAVCLDQDNPEARAEYDTFAEVLSGHLRKHGKWLAKGKQMKDGRIANWIPKKPQAVTPV